MNIQDTIDAIVRLSRSNGEKLEITYGGYSVTNDFPSGVVVQLETALAKQREDQITKLTNDLAAKGVTIDRDKLLANLNYPAAPPLPDGADTGVMTDADWDEVMYTPDDVKPGMQE